MSEQMVHKLDRTGWPAGPWDQEPDKLNWTTRAGLPGMIVRNRNGALCGYAAVERSHPWYGKQPWDLDVNVHYELNYADRCSGVICHVPEPGQPDDVWWFGFDCHHFRDFAPGAYARTMATMPEYAHLENLPSDYRDLAWVQAEVERMAEQLAAAQDG